jgi:integrase/recombinase XerC
MAGKRAKVLSAAQVRAVLAHVKTTRHAARDGVIVLLSHHAALRASEIANVEWSMVLTSEGEVGDVLALEDRAAKRGGGGTVPLSKDLRGALICLHRLRQPAPDDRVIYSERGPRMTGASIVQWFRRTYTALGIVGASSHSGRRGFITNAARKIALAGGSIRDVQAMARHRSLSVTASYIETDTDAQRRVVDMV